MTVWQSLGFLFCFAVLAVALLVALITDAERGQS